METLKRFLKLCGALCGVIITFIITMGTLALTNAFSPTSLKTQMTDTANLLINMTSEQALAQGVPESWVSVVTANIGIEQLIAVAFMALISFALATLAFIGSVIWVRMFGKRKINTTQLENVAAKLDINAHAKAVAPTAAA